MITALPYSFAAKRVWVAGEHGMVGSALLRRLRAEPCEVLRLPRRAIDFREQAATYGWIKANRPHLCANSCMSTTWRTRPCS